jgi:hypothetical protein
MKRRLESLQLNSATNYSDLELNGIKRLKDGTYSARSATILSWINQLTTICMTESNSLKKRFLIKVHVAIKHQETKS